MKLEKEFLITSIDECLCTPELIITGSIKLNKNEKIETYWNGKYKAKLTLEVEEPILDDAERKYLNDVIRPFRDRVVYIEKQTLYDNTNYIIIATKRFNSNYTEIFKLPSFKANTMYKNLELNKEYSLEELDL